MNDEMFLYSATEKFKYSYLFIYVVTRNDLKNYSIFWKTKEHKLSVMATIICIQHLNFNVQTVFFRLFIYRNLSFLLTLELLFLNRIIATVCFYGISRHSYVHLWRCLSSLFFYKILLNILNIQNSYPS